MRYSPIFILFLLSSSCVTPETKAWLAETEKLYQQQYAEMNDLKQRIMVLRDEVQQGTASEEQTELLQRLREEKSALQARLDRTRSDRTTAVATATEERAESKERIGSITAGILEAGAQIAPFLGFPPAASLLASLSQVVAGMTRRRKETVNA